MARSWPEWLASRTVRLTRATGDSLADLLIPRCCGLCGAFGAFLCAPCLAALPPLDGMRCPGCANPLPDAAPRCHRCDAQPSSPLDSLSARFRFEDGARRLVHRLKYERLSALAGPMGVAMADAGLFARITPDLIVPVPLHPRRQRERGFNQSALLAHSLAQAHGLTVEPHAIQRVRSTAPQARTAHAADRARNVGGAFACRGDMAGRTVLLVDDVATTGATVRACAEALRDAGATAVHALTFAHED